MSATPPQPQIYHALLLRMEYNPARWQEIHRALRDFLRDTRELRIGLSLSAPELDGTAVGEKL